MPPAHISVKKIFEKRKKIELFGFLDIFSNVEVDKTYTR